MPKPMKDPAQRRRRNVPTRGEIKHATAVGWQHGRRPAVPRGLGEPAKRAWSTWMGSWFASFWTPDDLPGLEVLICLYDEVRKGATNKAGELRLQMDTYGITPKGQQDRRWRPPTEEPAPGVSKASRDEVAERRERRQVAL